MAMRMLPHMNRAGFGPHGDENKGMVIDSQHRPWPNMARWGFSEGLSTHSNMTLAQDFWQGRRSQWYHPGQQF